MESVFSVARRPAQRGHPVGGYALIPVWQLCRLWDTYRRGIIPFSDVRLWMASYEAQERRCTLREGRVGFYSARELERLTGGSSRVTAAGIERLRRAGLMAFSETRISFGPRRLDLATAEPSLVTMLEGVENHRRAVPVPRRTLRMLAQCNRPAVVATAFGHLFRCVYYRSGEVVSWGRCKASWVAETFHVVERSVKGAREHLCGLKWLVKLSGRGGPATKRWGGAYQVELTWERPLSYADAAVAHNGCMEFSPQRPIKRLDFALCLNQNPLLSEEILKPEPRPAGADSAKAQKGKGAEEKSLRPPTLRHVVRADLTETTRTLELFRLAVDAKLISGSEHGRLTFVSLAEHALLHGTKNPCGLFMKLLREKRYYITQDDEEAARQRINRELYQVERRRSAPREPAARAAVREDLPKDVKMALAIEHTSAQKHLAPVTLIRAMKLDWTIEHYQELLQTAEDSRLRGLSARMKDSASDDARFA